MPKDDKSGQSKPAPASTPPTPRPGLPWNEGMGGEFKRGQEGKEGQTTRDTVVEKVIRRDEKKQP